MVRVVGLGLIQNEHGVWCVRRKVPKRLEEAVARVLKRSNFPLNAHKTQSPRREIVVFNMRVSQGSLRFTDERMWKFVTRAVEITEDKPNLYDKLFGDYVSSINLVQAKQLRASVGVNDLDED
jgi:hypothetical protein